VKVFKNLNNEEFKKYCRDKNLKETDIMIAELLRQELSSSEIAEITHYSIPTIKQRRLIIKAKLGL
jgi:DNA-binding CsgD family transcriptional regulator